MKKFLLILTGMLLFSMTARADVCANTLFGHYVATTTCGGYREYCGDCPPGCRDCHGVTVTWVCESGGVRSYADDTVSSCDVCFDGYELKEAFTGSWEGEDNNTYRTVTRYMCEERDTPVCPSNCSSCSDSSTCTSCDYGYSLSNGKCVSGSEEDSSSKCGNGYVLINGVCEEICQYQVNLEGGVCMKYCAGTVGSSSQIRRMCLYARCFDGRAPKSTTATYLGENIPHRYCCPENCADCSDWGQCTSCNSGYTLSNGKCVTSVSCDSGSVEIGGTCVKAATCTYPLKEVADYSGECAGCCTD